MLESRLHIWQLFTFLWRNQLMLRFSVKLYLQLLSGGFYFQKIIFSILTHFEVCPKSDVGRWDVPRRNSSDKNVSRMFNPGDVAKRAWISTFSQRSPLSTFSSSGSCFYSMGSFWNYILSWNSEIMKMITFRKVCFHKTM